jgi:hypothetical protein
LKEKGGKPERRPNPLLFSLRNPYRNLKSDNSQYEFMNSASGQALCGPCRDHTHRAKMFSQHEIIHMAQKTKEQLIKKVTILVVKRI